MTATPATTRVHMGDVITPRNDIIHPRDNPTGPDVFVGLEHVESGTGRRLGSEEIDKATMTGRKATFRAGDIVYGYLRPYLNKVWLADFDGLCSVDQYVYVVDQRKADAEYIAWFMRSPLFLSRAPVDSGPGQLPRIRLNEIARVELDLPPLPEQKRVAEALRAEMDAAARLRAAAALQLEHANRLELAELRRIFDRPEAEDWPQCDLRDLCIKITDGTHQPPPFTEDGVPFLFVRNIVSGSIDLDTEKYVTQKTFEALTRSWRAERGDILFSAVGSFGVAVVVETDRPFAFQRHIALLKPQSDEADPRFLSFYLNSPRGKAQSEAQALGGAQRTVTLGSLGGFRVPRPPLDTQRRVAAKLHSRLAVAAETRARVESQAAEISRLPAALLRRAFTAGL